MEAKSETIQKVETALKHAECHFLWEPCKDDPEACPKTSIETIGHNLNGGYPSKEQAMLLIGYLHTLTKAPDYQKAIDLLDEILTLSCENDMFADEMKGYKYIAMANKLHVFLLRNKFKEHKISKLLTAFQLEQSDKFSDRTKATILATEGFALTHFGEKKYERSLELYRQALDLDPNNPRWWMGNAFIAGRIRWRDKGYNSRPKPFEESYLRKAVKLTNEKNSYSITLLAHILLQIKKSTPYSKEDANLVSEVNMWCDKALKLDPESSNVLTRVGKLLCRLGNTKKGFQCLEHAVEIDPKSSHSLFRLAHCCSYCRDEKRLKLGLDCVCKAIKLENGRFLPAEFIFAKLQHILDSKFDRLLYLNDIKDKYEDSQYQLEKINKMIEHLKINQPEVVG